jgi:hypothetical protein
MLRHLKGTSSFSLHLTRGCFTDVDWAGSFDDRKSTGGCIVFLDTTLISWKSSKQCTVTYSSTKAEYNALADGTIEVFGFVIFQHICVFLPVLLPPFGATIWVLRICLLILFFMHVQSMLRLIITLFVIEWLKTRYRFALYLPKTN